MQSKRWSMHGFVHGNLAHSDFFVDLIFAFVLIVAISGCDSVGKAAKRICGALWKAVKRKKNRWSI